MKKGRISYIRDGRKGYRGLSAFDKLLISHPWFVVLLGFLGIMMLSFGVLYVLMAPELEQMRQTCFFVIALALLKSGLILFFTYRERKMPRIAKISLVFAALSIWIPFVIHTSQIILMIDIVATLFLITTAAYCGVFLGKEYLVLIVTACFFAITNIKDTIYYSFVNSPDGVHFWQVGIVIAIIGTLVFGFFIFSGKTAIRKPGDCIGVLLLSFIVCFSVGWMTVLNLNYVLDSPLNVQEFEIVDCDFDMGHRKLTRYKFFIDVNGESVELSVPQSKYYSKEKGETVAVSLYNGFFNDPFYIVE